MGRSRGILRGLRVLGLVLSKEERRGLVPSRVAFCLCLVVVQGLALGIYDGLADFLTEPVKGYQENVSI